MMQTTRQNGCFLNSRAPFLVPCHHPASTGMDSDCTNIMGQPGDQGQLPGLKYHSTDSWWGDLRLVTQLAELLVPWLPPL